MTTLILAFVYPLVVAIIIRLQLSKRKIVHTMENTVLTVVTKDETVYMLPLNTLDTDRAWLDPIAVSVTVPTKEHRR